VVLVGLIWRRDISLMWTLAIIAVLRVLCTVYISTVRTTRVFSALTHLLHAHAHDRRHRLLITFYAQRYQHNATGTGYCMILYSSLSLASLAARSENAPVNTHRSVTALLYTAQPATQRAAYRVPPTKKVSASVLMVCLFLCVSRSSRKLTNE